MEICLWTDLFSQMIKENIWNWTKKDLLEVNFWATWIIFPFLVCTPFHELLLLSLAPSPLQPICIAFIKGSCWGLDEAFQSPSTQPWEKGMKPSSAPMWTGLAHDGATPGSPLQLTPKTKRKHGIPSRRALRTPPGRLCWAAGVFTSWFGFKKFPSHWRRTQTTIFISQKATRGGGDGTSPVPAWWAACLCCLGSVMMYRGIK